MRLKELQHWRREQTETSQTSLNSPYETPQPLSAAGDLSISAGTSSVSPSTLSGGQTNNSKCHIKLPSQNHNLIVSLHESSIGGVDKDLAWEDCKFKPQIHT